MRLDKNSLMGGKPIAVKDDLVPLQSELTEHKADRVNHVTTAERNEWSGKETPSGAQAKVDTHANLTNNPHSVTKAQVGLGNVTNILQASKTEFDAHAADSALHVTSVKQAAWDAKETPAGAQAKADAALSSAKGYTDTEVAKLVASSPATLDTLNELASALGNDPNFATTMTNQLGSKLNSSLFTAHSGDATHITAAERTSWNSKAAGTHGHALADITGLQTALNDRYTKAEGNGLYAAKTVTLTGGTGITTAIGDLSANRTISIDSTVARKDSRSDGYHWMRRASSEPTLYVTQQSTGPIARFMQGAGDGTVLSEITNDGQFSGNAYTASRWTTTRTLSLTGNVSGSALIDGSANVSINVTVADDSHNHSFLLSKDRRSTTPANFSNSNPGVEPIFTSLDLNGTTPYADALVLSTYRDSSGGGLNMLAFRKDKGEIYHRFGAWNGTAWESGRRIAYADELKWQNLEGVPTTFEPNAHNHDDRYYTETEVNGFLSGKSDTTHNHTLDSLSDTLMTSKATNQFLKWNGSKWVNSALAATDIPALDAGKVTSGTFLAARLPSATTAAVGITQLNDAVNSTSTTQAATANAVKKANDLAAAALPKTGGTVTGATTFSSTVEVGGDLDVNGSKIYVGGFSLEFNSADQSVDFVFA